jgi:hypothetical protein
MITIVYYIVSIKALPVAYNYWAVLGLDIFTIFFWLVSMSLLASEVAAFSWAYGLGRSSSDCYTAYGYKYCAKKRDLEKRATTNVYTYRNALAAAAGLGGLELYAPTSACGRMPTDCINSILFAVTLVLTSLAIYRHRKAGGHCTPGAPNTSAATHEPKDVELQGGAAPLQQPQQEPVYYPAQPQVPA